MHKGNDILEQAKRALEEVKLKPESPLHQIARIDPATDNYPMAMDQGSSLPTETFEDIPTQLRQEDRVDLYTIRKLNLAATMEALDKSVKMHDSFPTSDAAMAVGQLAEQVSRLTKEVEKSQDPRKLFDAVLDSVLRPLTNHMIQSLVAEMKWLKEQTKGLIKEGSEQQFDDLLKQAIKRVGPGLTDALDNSKGRLAKTLNLKEEPREKIV